MSTSEHSIITDSLLEDDGIDFSDPSTGKPGSLANSAVLRMLEEEERDRSGKLHPSQVQAIREVKPRTSRRFDYAWPPAGLRAAKSWDGHLDGNSNYLHNDFLKSYDKDRRKVVWPPAPENNGYHSPQLNQPQAPARHAQHSPSQASPRSPNHQPSHPSQQHQTSPREHQIPIQIQGSTHLYQTPTQQYQQAACEGKRQEQAAINRLIPVNQGVSPAQASPITAQPYRPVQKSWAPVSGPISPQPTYGSQQPAFSQQQHSPQTQAQYSPQPQYTAPPHYQPPQRQFEAPPATITLRPQPPIHQRPAPVYTSQPATTSFQGGNNMRGDQKWPPREVRDAVAAENEMRRQLAKGPACRPRKVHKDYASFFAQNALNSNYPGYRAPPGTQHYAEHSSGQSTF